MTENMQIILNELPSGKLQESHFQIRSAPMPSAQDGQLLVQNILLSLDAANRAWMHGATYRAAVKAGDVMHGYGLCEVLESCAPGFQKGDLVLGEIGWQKYGVLNAKHVERALEHRPLTQLLSVLGVAGKTAYHGLIHVPGIQAGETLLVSAAAGSVGSLVGQIGKIKGAHVVGIAGGPQKCAWVVEELGFDACIDYKNEELSKALKIHCPDGVDVYFDNVGGTILQAALFAMKMKGRISCCGAIAMYDGAPLAGPVGIPGLLVVKRLKMEGFVVFDFPEKDEQAVQYLAQWTASGQLKVVEDVMEGLENAPKGLVGLLAGENRGKRMIRVSDDPA